MIPAVKSSSQIRCIGMAQQWNEKQAQLLTCLKRFNCWLFQVHTYTCIHDPLYIIHSISKNIFKCMLFDPMKTNIPLSSVKKYFLSFTVITEVYSAQQSLFPIHVWMLLSIPMHPTLNKSQETWLSILFYINMIAMVKSPSTVSTIKKIQIIFWNISKTGLLPTLALYLNY